MKKILSSFLLCFSPFCVFATSDTLTISLPEALVIGEQNVIVLKNANLDLEIARKKILESAAIALPQVDAIGSYQGILGELPTANFGGTPITLVNTQQMYAKLQVSMSITGSYFIGLHAARVYKQMSEQQIEKTKIQLRFDISRSYCVLLTVAENLQTMRRNLENMQVLYSDMKKNAQVGMVDLIEADQIKLSVNMLTNTVRSLERQHTLAEDMLKFNMGIPLETPIRLTDDLPEIVDRLPQGIALSDTLNLDSNIDYKLSDTQIELQKSNLKLTLMNYLPRISAFYSLQDYIFGAPSLNMQPKNIIGGTITVPIFSSGSRYAKTKQAQFEVQKATYSKILLADNLKLQFANAMNTYVTTYENYLLQIENKTLAEKVYNNFHIKYRAGMASSSELIQANDKYLQTILNYLEQQNLLIKARLELDKLMNNL